MSSIYQKKAIKKKRISSKEKSFYFTHLEGDVRIVDISI